MKKNVFIVFSFIAIASLVYLNYFRKNKNDISSGVIFTEAAPKPIGPYSQAIMKGNCLFVSGQIAINPKTNELDTSSFENETKQVMENIKVILKAAKMEMNTIAKSTIYLTDLKNFKAVNEIYGSYFPVNAPARETVQVVALPKGARIEISVVAVH